MEVYIIRHGESETNKSGMHCGWADAELTALGHEQAKKSGRLISHVNFDKVFVSDLVRAKQTAELALPGYLYHFTDKLREINVGRLSYQSSAVCLERYGRIYSEAINKHDYRNFEGESLDEMMKRVTSFMHDLENLNTVNTVAIVGHEGTARCILSYTLNYIVPAMQVKLDNGAVSKFTYQNGIWKLSVWNYTGSV